MIVFVLQGIFYQVIHYLSQGFAPHCFAHLANVKQDCSEFSMFLAEPELIVRGIISVPSAHGEILGKAVTSETQSLCYCGVVTNYISRLSRYEDKRKENSAALY